MQSETQKGIKLTKRKIGKNFEKIAEIYLLKRNYEILEKNLYIGNNEIDILAKKDDNYYLFEVKGGSGEEDILSRFSKKKLNNLRKLAELVCLKYEIDTIFIDGIVIVTMEGKITIVHLKNIL